MSMTDDLDRYERAMHAVMTGCGYLIAKDPSSGDHKQLLAGTFSSFVSQKAVTDLLLDKGVFTLEEHAKAQADAAEQEVQRVKAELEKYFPGVSITLH